MNQLVGIPFSVPKGKYCFTYEGESYTCCYMDNKFNPFCIVLHEVAEKTEVGVLKCKKCLEAKVIKNKI